MSVQDAYQYQKLNATHDKQGNVKLKITKLSIVHEVIENTNRLK